MQTGRGLLAEVLPGARGGDASPRGAGEVALHQEVRLVDVFESVGPLAHRGGDGLEPHRPAAELVDQRAEDAAVHRVEAGLVHLEPLQRAVGDFLGDAAVALHFREIADAAQEPVGDARSPASAPRDLARSALVEVHAQLLRGATDDLLEIFGGVVVEAADDAEAVAQRAGEQPRPRGRTDEREGLERQLERAGAGAVADDDVESESLHRRVQVLLDRRVHPVDLVDEENVIVREVGQDSGQVSLALQRRSRGDVDLRAELVGDDVGERGLAQARRAAEEDVIERLLAPCRRFDEDLEVLDQRALPDHLREVARAQRQVEARVVAQSGGSDRAVVEFVVAHVRNVSPTSGTFARVDRVSDWNPHGAPVMRRSASRS